ncbi:Electron transfer flavoprotein [Caenispirillum salinarum AK4]|uniref:Electron transfer flavoprotein subunit alpha n=1 Tax=Caenispirillum salinarum AK4 TaxID=1238182 RepID=K9H226_9PROT|nr:FAD-binding protein [Caenispirillum salinarum]EKV32335.1 Electron transfer flavoprotein [Caenispirillum salinarum AK4]
MSILVIGEIFEGALRSSVYPTVTAAKQLSDKGAGDIHLLVAGKDIGPAAEAAAKIDGVAKVLKVDAETYAHPLAEPLSLLIKGMAEGYSHILAPADTFGKNVMPRVAALLDVAQISEISEVLEQDTFVRPIYAGNAMATVQSKDSIKIITVRGTNFDGAAPEGGSASVEDAGAGDDPAVSSFVGQELSKSERPELTSAKIVVSGGRGMGSGENFKHIEALADKLGAAVGASRAAVDAGFVPNDYQVGQTGKVVAPELYIAVGISGAIQHLAGMKDSKVIVAINKDEEAPIFQVADYGLVADLFQALPELEQEIDKVK